MRFSRSLIVLVLVGLTAPALAAVPGSIEVTCDVARTNFRAAAVGQSDVKFKLWSAATAGTQIGSNYAVPMAALAVFKQYTETYDSVKKRKAARINALIGSDASPVLLPADGIVWLDVTVGLTTLGCDFAATGGAQTRRRLQSVPFTQQGQHPTMVQTATSASSITIGPLDLDTDRMYQISAWVHFTSATDIVRAQINGDTGAHYGFLDGSSGGGGSANVTSWLVTGTSNRDVHLITFLVAKEIGHGPIARWGTSSMTIDDSGYPNVASQAGGYSQTTNVTSLTFYSSAGATGDWRVHISIP